MFTTMTIKYLLMDMDSMFLYCLTDKYHSFNQIYFLVVELIPKFFIIFYIVEIILFVC